MAKFDGQFVLLTPVPILHPHLFEAKAYKDDDKNKVFSATFLMVPDAEETKAAKEHAVRIAKAKWPGVAVKDIRFPFRSGDKAADKRAKKCKEANQEPDGEFQRGKLLLQTKSKRQPVLAIVDGQRIVDIDPANEAATAAHKGKFYFGAECLAELNFACNEVKKEDNEGNDICERFVTAYLNRVVSTNRGKALGASRRSSAETFKGYRGSVSAVDPTKELEDEIPF